MKVIMMEATVKQEGMRIEERKERIPHSKKKKKF